MAHLGQQGLAISTIEVYLAGLRYFNLLANPSEASPSLHSPFLKLLLRGIQRANVVKKPALVRLPITRGILAKIRAALAVNPLEYDSVLTWAAACTGFFGFLRTGEFLTPDSGPWDPQVHLALADIALTNIQSQRAIILRIKASKTDQLRTGTTIVLGATKAEICPVAALLDYLNRRGCTPGPLFITEGGTPLRRQAFVDNIQQALMAAGLEGSKFNGHSFRIGAATTASEVGVPETTIKILGRWRSMAYQRYIRPPPDKLAQVATMLVSPVSSGSELS